MLRDDEVEDVLGWVEQHGVGLTSWELDFLASIRAQWDAREFLSEKQRSILERIAKERAGVD